jgi:hypothetical protein
LGDLADVLAHGLDEKKVNKTAVTKNSHVLYALQLRRNDHGVWALEKLDSRREGVRNASPEARWTPPVTELCPLR